MKLVLLFLIVSVEIVTSQALAQAPRWRELPTGTQSSLRSLVVARNSTRTEPALWAAGSKGTILLSTDLGQHWQLVGPSLYPELEFRSLHAWYESQAIAASAGTPAIVLKTMDGGKSWREVYRDPDPKAFFDGLKFFEAKASEPIATRGVLFGDPVDGRMSIVTTQDAGETWQAISRERLPEARQGEAAFAASNSAMIVSSPSNIFIGTGGCDSPYSRLLRSNDFGQSWQAQGCPLVSGASKGIFSLALGDGARTIVAVGGDYQPDAKSATTATLSLDGGSSFTLAAAPPASFRSSVVYAQGKFYATGPAGTDSSADGNRWQRVSDIGFHVMAVLPDGRIIAVGSGGRFGLLE